MTRALSRLARAVPIAAALGLAAGAASGQQGQSIAFSRHNLSVSGPGPFRAASESQICIFCHAPHRARSTAPLWNREDSRASYLTYRSSTFEGSIAQPNGSTKLCLSCHDGTIAVGAVVSLNGEIAMLPASRFLREAEGSVGTNLRDDHPVSFDYSGSKGGRSDEYRPAAAIAPPVRLDDLGQLQCTSCHDAHDDSHGDFLRITDRYSTLCLACHQPKEWDTSSHARSEARWSGAGENPWPFAKYETVAENGCANCHPAHGAGLPDRLLVFAREEDNCLKCHDGSVARTDLTADVRKRFAHSPYATQYVHDPLEDPRGMRPHAECQDCHNPHKARPADADAARGTVPGPLLGVRGVDSSGNVVAQIRFGYELCYRCHTGEHDTELLPPRLINQPNVRFEFTQGNPSYHPVEAPGRNADVPSLLPPWNVQSQIDCTDCHQSDTSPDFGGRGPRGPHGSNFAPLLGAQYRTTDGLPETPQAYALCYKCHSRGSILSDLTFPHQQHVVDQRASCAACHDAHGIASSQGTEVNNSHLINFDISVTSPNQTTGLLEYVDLGYRAGECSLTCHGHQHDRSRY